MRTVRSKGKQRGSSIVEVSITVALLMMLVMLAADGIFAYRHLHDRAIYQQAARWAAAGHLQRLQAGAPLDSLPPQEVLQEAITLTTSIERGEGQWKEFDLATVTARVILPNGKQASEEIRGYLPGRAEP
jgi:hypothetical protein